MTDNCPVCGSELIELKRRFAYCSNYDCPIVRVDLELLKEWERNHE